MDGKLCFSFIAGGNLVNADIILYSDTYLPTVVRLHHYIDNDLSFEPSLTDLGSIT